MNQTLTPPVDATEKSGKRWSLGCNGYSANLIYDSNGEAIAGVYGIPIHTRIENVPEMYKPFVETGALIAAAPELYAALEYIANEAEREYACGHAVAAARAALAKARGET